MEIIELDYCGIKMLDSYSYLPMALSTFPKALGFDSAKGYFPHLFNKRENWAYSGKLPDAW